MLLCEEEPPKKPTGGTEETKQVHLFTGCGSEHLREANMEFFKECWTIITLYNLYECGSGLRHGGV